MTKHSDQIAQSVQTLIDDVFAICAQQMSSVRDKRGARDVQKIIASMRDNLSYRLGSVRWHHRYLCELRSHLESQLLPTRLAEGESTSFLLRAAHQVSFVFDDVVFNVVSCFDYIARLVGFITLGPEGAGLKWNPLVNHARGGALKSRRADLAELILRVDSEFVASLQKYRGALIHRERMMGVIEGSFHMSKEGVSAVLVVSAPDALAKVLVGRASFKDQSPPDVLVASTAIIQRTVDCGSSLIHTLAAPPNSSA